MPLAANGLDIRTDHPATKKDMAAALTHREVGDGISAIDG